MPHSIPDAKRQEVIRLRQSGKTRDQIAKEVEVGTATVIVHSLTNLKKEGYNTGKIIARASMIETLENRVQGLDQRCGMLRSKRAIYQEAFQTCEQLASTGINILQ